MESVHAQCEREADVLSPHPYDHGGIVHVVCLKSHGHGSQSGDPAKLRHYDPSEEIYWTEADEVPVTQSLHVTADDVFDLITSGPGHVLCLDTEKGQLVARVYVDRYAPETAIVTDEEAMRMIGTQRRPLLYEVQQILPALQERADRLAAEMNAKEA